MVGTLSAFNVVQGKVNNLSIAIESEGAVDVVWGGAQRNHIAIARSVDQGKSWTTGPASIPSVNNLSQPAIALGPDHSINLAFVAAAAEHAPNAVFLSSSKDGGKTFSLPVPISATTDQCNNPCIAIAQDGTVHLAWQALASGKEHADVYHGEYREAANPQRKIYKVTNTARLLSGPAIACGRGERSYIVWTDNTLHQDSADVFCALVTKSNRMSTPINISATPGFCSNPSVCADRKGRVAVVWSDTSYGRPAVFSLISRDSLGDVSYVRDMSAFSPAEGPCNEPAVALSEGRACAIWEQDGGPTSRQEQMVKCLAWPLNVVGTGAAFDIHLKARNKSRIE